MKKLTFWLSLGLVSLVMLSGCGTAGKKGEGSRTSGDSSIGPDYVKVCKKPVETATATDTAQLVETRPYDEFALSAADPNWKDDIMPLFQAKCSGATCHNPDTAGRLNVRNFTNVVNAVANVRKRIENGRDLAAKITADTTIDDNDTNFNAAVDTYVNGEKPMPQPNRNNALTVALNDADYNMFVLWITNGMKQFGAGELGDDAPPLSTPTEYSDSEEDKNSFESLLTSANCQDGPDVNTDANWSKVAKLLDPGEPNKPDAGYYDYSAKQWMTGKKASFECTYDNFIASIGIDEVGRILNEYKAYGWRIQQCTVVNGLPLAGLVHLNDVSGKLGVSVKWFTMEVGTEQPK